MFWSGSVRDSIRNVASITLAFESLGNIKFVTQPHL